MRRRPAPALFPLSLCAPLALALALALALTQSACSFFDSDSGSCGGACEGTEQRLGLRNHTVHRSAQKSFTSEGETYTLVYFEYGDAEECDAFDDCSYSTYCGFVVDGVDYPLEVTWNSDADALFDPAKYCEDGELEGCELPGQTLPILDDEDFEDWVYEADPDEDVLAGCFADYS
jgi:hypothetical protein